MTLDEARVELEKSFIVGPQGNYRFAPTGEEYVEVCTGGLKPEGECSPVLCASPEVAVAFWLQTALAYANDVVARSGRILKSFDGVERKFADGAPAGFVLYWRILPELDGENWLTVDEKMRLNSQRSHGYMRKLYRVYSRFLVSDKPQIHPAMLGPRVLGE